MSAGTLLLSLVAVCVKSIPASSGVAFTQKLFFRGSVSAVVLLCLLTARRVPLLPRAAPIVLLRSLLGLGGMLCYFYSLEGLPISQAVTLNRLSPFFVLLFAGIFLGERLGGARLAAVAVGFLGVLVILRPGFREVTSWSLLALLSAVFSGGAYTTLRALGGRDGALVIVFWFSVVVTLAMAPFVAAGWTGPTRPVLALLVAIGLLGAGGQILMTRAFSCAPGGEVAVYGYLSVVFAAVWQTVIFGSVPEPPVLAGAALVIAGGWLSYRSGSAVRPS